MHALKAGLGVTCMCKLCLEANRTGSCMLIHWLLDVAFVLLFFMGVVVWPNIFLFVSGLQAVM